MKASISTEELDTRLYVRPKELASLCGIEETLVYRSIYAGQLRAQKFRGRVWLIRREDAEAWIDENSKPNTAEKREARAMAIHPGLKTERRTNAFNPILAHVGRDSAIRADDV